jgi:hypothetical protein
MPTLALKLYWVQQALQLHSAVWQLLQFWEVPTIASDPRRRFVLVESGHAISVVLHQYLVSGRLGQIGALAHARVFKSVVAVSQ